MTCEKMELGMILMSIIMETSVINRSILVNWQPKRNFLKVKVTEYE